MRKIEKRTEPVELRQWRAANQPDARGGGINYGYDLLRKSPAVVDRLMESLLTEQGGLCAYTGRRIGRTSAHVEHLVAQTHCERGQDVSYDNMVACWPEPNAPRGQDGAHPKADWPAPAEAAQFVSPLNPGCEARFQFNHRGEIKPSDPRDNAAAMTIKKLRLDHKLLAALRRSQIESVLGKRRDLKPKAARQRLKLLQQAEEDLTNGVDVQLDPYSFALKQALSRHLKACERIRKSYQSD
jgi:uncharacterized protein (TIGR02646 family)